jgi:phenylpropionate dioxygenase-like ring-hydroxylating dioxygenase large terminal subunit
MNVALNQWYAILSSRELRPGRPLSARRLGVDLVAWRDAAGKVALAVDRCPHRQVRLSPGRVVEGCIECPFHGFRFTGTGACAHIPAMPGKKPTGAMNLASLHAREAHGLIWAWTGSSPPPEDPIPFFDFSGMSWSGSEFIEPVACHYTRAVENQLDFPHLPFVHRTTIGRSLRHEMDVATEVHGDLIRGYLRDQDASFLEIQAPNVWRLRLGPTWGFLVMAPVDEGRMVYYSRAYQPFVTRGPFAWLLGLVNRVSNRFILRQDSAVVETHLPGESRLRGGEVLIPADGPIIAYRRWREARRGEFDPWGRGAPDRVRAAETPGP